VKVAVTQYHFSWFMLGTLLVVYYFTVLSTYVFQDRIYLLKLIPI